MKYNVFTSDNEEITIITEDGGIAAARPSEDKDTSTIADLYQSRITDEGITSKNVWSKLAEGKMYLMEWAESNYDSQDVINDLLDWLSPTAASWQLDKELFKSLVNVLKL